MDAVGSDHFSALADRRWQSDSVSYKCLLTENIDRHFRPNVAARSADDSAPTVGNVRGQLRLTTLLSLGMSLLACFMEVHGEIVNNLPSLGAATEFLLPLEIKGGHQVYELIIGVQAQYLFGIGYWLAQSG